MQSQLDLAVIRALEAGRVVELRASGPCIHVTLRDGNNSWEGVAANTREAGDKICHWMNLDGVPSNPHTCVWAAGCSNPVPRGIPFCESHRQEILDAAPAQRLTTHEGGNDG